MRLFTEPALRSFTPFRMTDKRFGMTCEGFRVTVRVILRSKATKNL